jgi:hypothetical protein
MAGEEGLKKGMRGMPGRGEIRTGSGENGRMRCRNERNGKTSRV